MDIPFTHKPGRRERHLRRQHENPLFAWPPRQIAPVDLLAAQKADHEEMEAFRESFVALVQQAIDLEPDTGSDRVLHLKEALELAYEQGCSLPEDHSKEKGYIRQLIALSMKALSRNVTNDPLARAELKDEETARTIHQRLLEQPLVADILHPQSLIPAEEFTPAVLDASSAEVAAILEIFDSKEVALLVQDATQILDRLRAQGVTVDTPTRRLRQMTTGLADSIE